MRLPASSRARVQVTWTAQSAQKPPICLYRRVTYWTSWRELWASHKVSKRQKEKEKEKKKKRLQREEGVNFQIRE